MWDSFVICNWIPINLLAFLRLFKSLSNSDLGLLDYFAKTPDNNISTKIHIFPNYIISLIKMLKYDNYNIQFEK